MKYIIGLVAMLLPLLCGAQAPLLIKPLTIGDTVPDITITNIYNYPSSTIRLSDLKGKLVILDFWATWCGSCIHGFTKLDSLQKEFTNEVRVILISNEGGKNMTESRNKVKVFLNKWKDKTNGLFSLPSTLDENDILRKLFPHMFIPYYVWVNSEREVIAITSSTEVNAPNIKAVLNKLPIEMPEKLDSLKFHHQN